MKYTKRVVAYIDILGFKEYIDNTTYKSGRDNKKAIDYLNLTYKKIKRVFKQKWYTVARKYPYKIPPIKNSKRVTAFSDSIVISFLFDEKTLITDVLYEIIGMQRELIWRGMICRGAITIGKLVHTTAVFLGPHWWMPTSLNPK